MAELPPRLQTPPAGEQEPAPAFADEIDALLGVEAPAARHLGGGARARLDETALELQLGRAYAIGYSGCLEIALSGGVARLWFVGGQPVDLVVGAPSAADRLAANAANVERALAALIARGETGSFVFDEGMPAPAHRTHLLRHPVTLVYEGLARKPTPERLGRWLGRGENQFRLREPLASLLIGEALFESPLAVALRLFDGTRSFRDVVRTSHQPVERLVRAAYALFCFGALDPAIDEAGASLREPSPNKAADPAVVDRARIAALAALAEESDYFEFLGLDRAASEVEVRARVAKLAAEIVESALHPDVVLATARERAVIAAVLDECARILGDDHLREAYAAGGVLKTRGTA